MPRKSYDDVIADPTKMSAEEKIGRTKQKLHESDRRSLNSDIDRREQEILAKKDLNPDADVADLKKEIAHKKMILQHDDDLVPKSGNERDRLFKRSEEIREILQKKMPTKREMWPKVGSVESQQAVRHNLKFQEECDGLSKEWQEIQKKLNPEDPYAQSLELIRPD